MTEVVVYVWIILSGVATVYSMGTLVLLSKLIDIQGAYVEVIRERVLDMLQNNRNHEYARFAAYLLFLAVGLRVALGFSPPLPVTIFNWDPFSVWAVVIGFASLVYGTVTEYHISRRYYRKVHEL